MTKARLAAVALAGAGVLLFLGWTWLSLVPWNPAGRPPTLDLVANWVSLGLLAVLGVRIVHRDRHHPIGWIMVVLVALDGLVTFAEAYAQVGLLRPGAPLPAAAAALVVSGASWVLAFAGLTILVLLFPDGRLPGPRWRPLVWVSGVAFVGSWCGATFQPGTLQAPFEGLPNPVGVAWLGGTGQIAVGTLVVSMFGCMLATTVAVVLRYRRSVGVERLQLRWLVYGAGLLPLALGVCIVIDVLTGVLTGSVDAVSVVFDLAIVTIPAAVGVAVLRYHLYDIDRLISRTVLYAALSVLLFTAFVSTAAIVGVATGRGSTWATAIAAAVTVAVLRPLRNRLQVPIDRRFDRARFDGVATVDRFLDDLRADRTDPEGLEDVLRRALGDPALRVWLWLPARADWVDIYGRPGTDPSHLPAEGITRLDHGGAPLAIIAHGPSSGTRPDILTSVLDRARLAIEIARLRAEVSATLDDVEQSRKRIVEAGYEERRRLERDLHDGAQQRLVSLGISLRRLERSLPSQARILEPALDQAVAEIGRAIADLRRIASGVRPARLDDGLAAALEDLASHAPIPVAITVPAQRVPPTVEAAAYYVACEAITNAVKHADATHITVHAERRNGSLHLLVADDGIGGAQIRPGTGLAGLVDRVSAHGGTLRPGQPSRCRYPDGGTPAMRIVIAEDTVLLREGLAGLMEDAGHDVVAKVGDGDSLVAVVAEHEPDLAVVDVRMPPNYQDEGLIAAATIRYHHPSTAVLVLSQHVETRHCIDLVTTGGGFGYLLKDRVLDVDDFLDAADRVAHGGTALDPEVVTALLTPRPTIPGPLDTLTDREIQVLALMAEGRTNGGIARRLWLTEKTVENHNRAIMTKLALDDSIDDNRRVLAVLTYLKAAPRSSS